MRHDAAGPLLLGVGVHQLIVRAPEGSELRRELIVQGREEETLVLRSNMPKPAAEPAPLPPPIATPAPIRPRPAPPKRPNHTPAIVAFSVGGAGVIVGTVSGIIAFSKKHDVDDLDAGYLAADISTTAWIAAGVGQQPGSSCSSSSGIRNRPSGRVLSNR